MSSIINRTQVVYLKFNSANGSVTTGYVSCPYPVKEILIKNIICSSTDTVLGQNFPDSAYGLLFSDLVSNMYLGSIYLNSQYQSQLIHNVRYCYKTPQRIGGNYTFTLGDVVQPSYPSANNPISVWSNYGGGAANDTFNVAVVFEFISEESTAPEIIGGV